MTKICFVFQDFQLEIGFLSMHEPHIDWKVMYQSGSWKDVQLLESVQCDNFLSLKHAIKIGKSNKLHPTLFHFFVKIKISQ